MPATNQPRGVSPWFLIAIGGVFALMLVVFMLAVVFRHHTETLPPALRQARENNDWVNKFHPSPTPTPARLVTHRVNWTPLVVQPFHVIQQQQSHAAATPSQWERERIERYHKALIASAIVRQGNGQVLETPRLLADNSQQNSPITVKASPAHTIPPWSMIYAVLQTAIQSDHAGDVLARVTQPVRDSTMTEVLIPAGSMLHGWQGGREALQDGDSSLTVVWNQIVFPNGGTMDLPGAPSMNAQGFAGLDGDVNHHYARIWGPALLISAITAGVALASHPTYGYGTIDPEQQAFGAGAEVLGGRAIGQLDANMSIKPTITVPAGTLLRVLVNHPVTFSGAYQE
jgi:type IV secretory pathway VirB10-like protein